MPFEVTCRTCGRVFTTLPGDVLKGPRTWQYCEACRATSIEDAMTAPANRRALFSDSVTAALPVPPELAG